MNKLLGLEQSENPLQKAFLGWQCLSRQLVMREERGRPNDAVMPLLTLKGEAAPLGAVVTVLNRKPQYSMLPEMQHIARRTADPAQRLDKAVQFFSATYFQNPSQFSDMLTCLFAPRSVGAQKIRSAEYCQLDFQAYGQSFCLACRVWRLAKNNPLYAETWWHNHLFNPRLSDECVILCFEPNWAHSSSDTGK